MMSRNQILIAVLALVLVAGAGWYFLGSSNPLPVSASDHLSSWQLPLPQDIATARPKLESQIADLKAALGGGAYPDADIHLGIGNDYALLGDGKAAYEAYIAAINASSTYALAYDNMGGLFARLHATSTALRAYAKAVELAPSQELFQITYLNFLAQAEPKAQATAEAFASAKATLGADSTSVLLAESAWLGTIGRYDEAIKDLQRVESLEPGMTAAIEARIRQLKAH